MKSRRRGAGSILGGMLLNIAALAGLVCIVLVVLSLVFHISLIMFKTGSMTPAIPQGSLAVVKEIPASEIEVGDVVTVERDGMLPISHRVTSIEPGDTDSSARIITMKGDANKQEDPNPYEVSDVRLVLFSVPGLARVIVWFSDPWVLGALTLAAAALVTWAFWPRDTAPASAASAEAGSRRRHRHAHSKNGSASALAVVATGGIGALLGGMLALGPSPAAHAAPTVDVTEGRVITMTTIGDAEAMRSLSADAPVTWQVGIDVDDAPNGEDGTATVDLSSSGDLVLSSAVRACTKRWDAGTCPGQEVPVDAPDQITGTQHNDPLLSLPTGNARWLLFTLTAPSDPQGTVEVTVRTVASGDEVSTGGDVGALPYTGTNPFFPGILAVGAIAVGLLLAGIARARARMRGRDRP